MKNEYVKPSMQWVPMRSNDAVADVCWAYAKNGKDFYHDIPGYGHAILRITSNGGCNGGVLFAVEFSDPNMTSAQIASAKAYMDKVIAQAKAESGGGKATSYKGSPFEGSVSPSWS